MPQVTLIRHAESEFNVNPIQDKKYLNCDITQRGMKQARKLDFTFDLLIMTPLKRSQTTYIHSNIKAKKLNILSLFREYKQDVSDFFEWEDIVKETEDEIIGRVRKAIFYLKNVNERNIGIIGHRDFIMYFINELTGNKAKILDNCDYIIVNV